MMSQSLFRRYGILLLILLALAGCSRGIRRPAPRPAPVQSVPPVVQPPPPPAIPPPPTELDLTMEAATKARYGGDRAAAMQLYEKAVSLAQEGVRRAEIRFALALLYADSGSETRDLERSRAELALVVSDAPDGPHAAEARLLSFLMDELTALRAQTAEMKNQSEAARAEMAALNLTLQEKEKELAEIKKILLQDKAKP